MVIDSGGRFMHYKTEHEIIDHVTKPKYSENSSLIKGAVAQV